MADQFSAASDAIGAAKLGALQALATGGSQAKAAFDAAQAASASEKADALKGAMAQAVAFDAPEAGASLEPRISRPFDSRATAIGDAAASRAAALRQISAAQGAYMGEVNAAIPIVQARAQEKLAAAQEKAAKTAAAEQRSQAAAMWSQLGGIAGAKTLVGQQADDQMVQTGQAQGPSGTVSAHNLDRPYGQVALDKAQGLGIPNPAAGVIALDVAKARAAADAKQAAADAKVAKDPTLDPSFAHAETAIALMAQSGIDRDTFLSNVNGMDELAMKPAVKAALISKYGRLFKAPAASALPPAITTSTSLPR